MIKLTYISILSLLVLCVCCKNKSGKTEKAAEKQIQKSEAPVVTEKPSGQLVLSIKGRNQKLDLNDAVQQFSKIAFPEKTIIESDGISPTESDTANIVISDSAKYVVEIKNSNGTIISVHDRQGNQTGSAVIFNKKNGSGYTHYIYNFITLNDVRIHLWNNKSGTQSGERPFANIKDEAYLHLHINKEGAVKKVEKPQNILDFFCILPTRYLYQYINGLMSLFPDLMSGYHWYHTYESKSRSAIVDKKNGYVNLISTMAVFKAKGIPYFVLTNSAGGTCETFYYYYFLTWDKDKNRFTELKEDDILPKIEKLNLYKQPDVITNKNIANAIQLKFIVPRHGTIMKLEPYIDECGVGDDPELFGAMSQTKPVDLKWDRAQSRFVFP